ncbi:M-phase phosphoprotein 8-like isoform X2 [Paramacrobiotus metropolitanus]|nr:M-phase phosphoprotein 8-like isoform X2 [Paramacrobiotus metropolitanus]
MGKGIAKKKIAAEEDDEEQIAGTEPEDDSPEEHEIEKIEKKRKVKNGSKPGVYYKVVWKNWNGDKSDEHEFNWVHESDMHCEDLIKEFNERGMETEDEDMDAVPSAESGSDENQWEVEAIVDRRKRGRYYEYKIKWKDCSESENTWEPQKNLNCTELLERYNREHPVKTPKAKGSASTAKKRVTSAYPTRRSSGNDLEDMQTADQSSPSRDQDDPEEQPRNNRKTGTRRRRPGNTATPSKSRPARGVRNEPDPSPVEALGDYLEDWPGRPSSSGVAGSSGKTGKPARSTKEVTSSRKSAGTPAKKRGKRALTPEIEEQEEGDGVNQKEYTKVLMVRLMHGPVITRCKAMKFNPEHLGHRKLEYNSATIADPEERVTVIGRMTSIVHKLNCYICVQEDSPKDYQAFSQEDMHQYFPKTLEKLNKLEKSRKFKTHDVDSQSEEDEGVIENGVEVYYSKED